MTKSIVFDIETNGLDYKAEGFKVHCICLKILESPRDIITGCDADWHKLNNYGDSIEYAFDILLNADVLIGHNIQHFDIPVLEWVFGIELLGKPFDTKLMASLMFPQYLKNKTGHDTGQSLKAWGKRLGILKGDYAETTDWQNCTEEMLKYCAQDVVVTAALYNYLNDQKYSKEAIDLETDVATIIQGQITNGVAFATDKAQSLYARMVGKKEGLTESFRRSFPDWQEVDKDFIPKRNDVKRGYIAGEQVKTYKTVQFNPASGHHIAKALIAKYNWEPQVLTPTGEPKTSEDVLETLNYPEAKALCEYGNIKKLIGMLSDGQNGWLKLVQSDNRIYGSINTLGTATGRMSHYRPNLAQVPSTRSYMGQECRQLFIASQGNVLVGCDAAGLEARCIAHYMASLDGGEMVRLITETDIHRHTAEYLFNKADITKDERNTAKTALFAFVYGARPPKLAKILNITVLAAEKIFAGLTKAYPKLKEFTSNVTEAAKRGYLTAIDGRRIPIETNKWGNPDSPVNYLIQGLGAIVMKKALVIAMQDIKSRNLKAFPVLNIHDEFVFECADEGIVVAHVLEESIKHAGEYYKLRCPLGGEAKIGNSWLEVH